MIITDHGTPVVSARQWVTGLSPNAAGNGWNFIAASWPGGQVPVEWAVIKNLTTSPSETIYQTTTHHYPVSIYSLGTAHGTLRAPNGRIFWPLFANYFAYYDPTTEQVHEFGPVVESPPIDPNASTAPYGSCFDAAGLLYFATQESQNRPSCVFSVDTNTLATTVLGYVGSGANAYTTYGYRMAADTGTAAKYVYVVYGEDPWQLWALNISNGTATKLYEVTSTGDITFTNIAGQGWIANIHTAINQPGDVLVKKWCLDGALYDYTVGQPPPVGAPATRSVTPASNPLVSPPNLDTSGGTGIVGWRNGTSGPYTYVDFNVNYSSPVALESLIATGDGILGNATSYQGFFQLHEPGDTRVWFGPWNSGIAQVVTLNVNGVLYLAGYPNTALYSYDPTAAWELGINPPSTAVNPHYLGALGLNGNQYAGTKYPVQLGWSAASGRVYCVGTRERNGSGMGIGYYDTGTHALAGTYSLSGMSSVLPTGMVVDDDHGNVIVATQNLSGSGSAPLMVIPRSLASVTTYAPLPFPNLGAIYPTAVNGVICGVMQSGSVLALYQFDTAAGGLAAYLETEIVGTVGKSTQHPDGTIWVVVGNQLVQVDPNDLAAVIQQDATSLVPVSAMAFAADNQTLFVAGGSPSGVASAQLFSMDTQVVVPVQEQILSRITLNLKNGGWPRFSITDPDIQEQVAEMLNEHATALDAVNATVAVSGVKWVSHAGSPEASVTGNPGDLCTDTTNGELYVKHSGTGNTGWKLVTHA